MLVCVDDIVAGVTDGNGYHYQDCQHQIHHGNAGWGRFQRRHPRGQGAPAAATGSPAMAGVNAVAVVTYAHYACVADCTGAMANAWEDTAGCAQANRLHENILKY